VNNPLTIANALELHRSRQLPRLTLYELRWRDGRVTTGFDSPEQAAESVHLVERAVVPGTFEFDGQFLKDCCGEKAAEICEVDDGL
jgi:hypothetical protein